MGKRVIEDWTDTGSNNEYKKIIPNLESNIRQVTEGGTPYSLGSGIGALNASEYFWDKTNKILYVRTSDSGDPASKTIELYTYYQAFGIWGTQTDMENLEIYQDFTADANFYLQYVRLPIIKKGSPVFTNLRLEIHPELSNAPTSEILATSQNTFDNTVNNSNTLTELWFRFNSFPLKATERYCLVLKANGTFTTSSHVGWVMLDSIYTDSATGTTQDYSQGSKRFIIIGRQP